MSSDNFSKIARRRFLRTGGAVFVATAVSALLAESAAQSAVTARLQFAGTVPEIAATAKSVIFLFMEGGPSHLDLFDPKPLLNQLAGQRMPDSFGDVITPMGESHSPLLASQRRWQQHGEAGTWVSNWLPHTAQCMDDIAVIRSCWADGINHSSGVCQMNPCSILGGRSSLGSWVSYGLGSENQNLPSFIVLQDNKSSVVNGPRNWSAGFMPAVYQRVRLHEGSEPIPNLNPRQGSGLNQQRGKLRLLDRLNRDFANQHPEQSELEARIAAYELAFRMQTQATDAFDVSREPKHIRDMYGDGVQARQILIARRLIERGVRFVQVWHGEGQPWDNHDDIEVNHRRLAKQCDQAIGALLTDLKQRGLLEETLVIWGGEFGRTPVVELPQKGANAGKINGRDHNHWGFTMWMAGGGVRGGYVHGATDEFGFRAVENKVHVHDLHATIMKLVGYDHEKFTYRYAGRDFRLTDVHGKVVEELIA